jgi:hypothetical protein
MRIGELNPNRTIFSGHRRAGTRSPLTRAAAILLLIDWLRYDDPGASADQMIAMNDLHTIADSMRDNLSCASLPTATTS